MTTSDSRDRFEKWCVDEGLSVRWNWEGDGTDITISYVSNNTRVAWVAWQAALSDQSPSVAVSELEALQAYYVSWGYEQLEPCDWSDPANGDVVIHLNDLRTLIKKAGSDE